MEFWWIYGIKVEKLETKKEAQRWREYGENLHTLLCWRKGQYIDLQGVNTNKI